MKKPLVLRQRVNLPIHPDATREELRAAYVWERERYQALADEMARMEFEREVLRRQLNEKELEIHRQAIEFEVERRQLDRRLPEDSGELAHARAEIGELREALRLSQAAIRDSRGSENNNQLRQRYLEILTAMKMELEHLRTIIPIRGLLAAKEAEVERVKRSTQAIPRGHRDRRAAEEMLRAHIQERDELHMVVETTDLKLEKEARKIADLMEQELSGDRPQAHSRTRARERSR